MDSGRVLAGRYRLVSPLGSGGMGAVWLAVDDVLGRQVAVKEFAPPPQVTETEADMLRERTLREAQTAARLSHPNVVRIYDVVQDGSRPWIVMELIRARSLRDITQEDGPLDPEHAARVGLQVLAALIAAHELGILHRDVKPSNVLIDDDGRVVLADFGIARADDSPTLTATGMIVGSPSYISPERARGERGGAGADLWSLGATLYAAVEGRPPYDRPGALATLTAVVTEQPDPPRRAGALWPVISGLLRHDEAERLSAAAAERLLRQLIEPPVPQSTAPMTAPAEIPDEVPDAPAALVADAAPALIADGREPVVAAEPPPEPVADPPPGHPADPAPAGLADPDPAGLADTDPVGLAEPELAATGWADREPDDPQPAEVAAHQPSAADEEAAQPRPADAGPLVAGPPIGLAAVPPIGGTRPEPVLTAGAQPAAAGPGPRRPRLPWMIAAAAALVVAAAGVVIGLNVAGQGTPAPGRPAAAGHSPTPAGPTPTPAGQGSSSPGSATPRSSSGPGPGTAAGLPAGWTAYHDPTGFSIEVPDGWRISHQGHYVYVSPPSGGSFLLIDQSNQPKPDPLADWQQQEAARMGTYPGYHRIRLEAVAYPQAEKAADWEFTYVRQGVPTHVLNRNILVDAHQAYALYWSTPASLWAQNFHFFQTFAASFRPRR